MKHTPNVFGRLVRFSTLLLACAPLAAQTTEADDEEVFELSPFEVSGSNDVGYTATSTLAGTRIRTDLRDVGSAITVVTGEFLSDVGATDTSTLLQYTVNAEVSGTQGTYAGLGNGTTLDETDQLRAPGGAQRVRGLAAADNTRDFYITDIPWDSYITSRVDIQRGPNALLFGLGSPAGIVNASLDSAQYFDSGEVQTRVGSYGSLRGSFDVNREVIEDVLAVRVEGLWDHQKFQQEPAYENDERYFGAVRFNPQILDPKKFSTTIRANFEHGTIDANRPRILPPYDSITPWFESLPGDGEWTTESGMGKIPVTNPYDARREDFDNFPTAADTPYYQFWGMNIRNDENPNYQPWLGTVVNQQQPLYFMNGATGEIMGASAGYINVGARWPDGTLRGPSDGLLGRQYSEQFFRLNSYSSYANNASLPLFGSGQYRDQSLTDPSVFDFYNNLIDGPNKNEWEDWDAYNVTITQTAFSDRVGVELAYDKQEYERGGFSFLPYTPALTMDVMRNGQDFYTNTGADGMESQTNPNYGRPYVTSDAGGRGSSYTSDREYYRASAYGEFRTEDVTDNSLLIKIFGRQRFNAAFNKEKYFFENRSWRGVANDQAWGGYWNDSDGSRSPYNDRAPYGIVYLGESIAGRDSASGANIPRVEDSLAFQDYSVRVFDSTWQRYDVPFGAPWTVPANLAKVFHLDADGNAPSWGNASGVPDGYAHPPADYSGPMEGDDWYWTQASNPANYTGWTSYPLNLIENNYRGDNENLLDSASKTQRETTSEVLTWQGYFWRDAIVPTLGWRKDEVKTKDVRAEAVPANRSILDMGAYELPAEYPEAQIFEDESFSYGAVVHINQLLGKWDKLPLNVSLSYNKSSNFQVVPVRRNLYGTPISNPTGDTKDYGILLSTKDNKYTLRVVKYETKLEKATSTLSNADGLGSIVSNGLNWRNVFLYDLAAYDYGGREAPSYRNTWTNAYPIEGYDDMTPEQQAAADAEVQATEDAAIRGWNEIQAWLTDKGFFEAWNFDPVPLQYLTDRSTYEATLTDNGDGLPLPAAQYQPPLDNVYAYSPSAPSGFTVTSDTLSEGYEFEFTANPIPGLRLSINGSRTEATQTNVGGPELEEFIDYMDSMLVDANGDPTPAGMVPRWGGAGNAQYVSVYAPWRANYVQLKLNEGSSNPEIRKWRWNFIANYTVQEGMFENVSVGGSYRWQDKAAIGYPVIETDTGYEFDIDNPVYGPSEDAIDVWIGYERKLSDKIGWRIQLNIRNLAADEGLIPVSIQPDGSYAGVRIKPTQEWFITNTFTF